jgi:hypothetical protein
MQIRVDQVLGGPAAVGDTLMVWGDNGALCRWYATAWSVGQTAVFGFHNTDFTGNWITNPNYPPNLEQPGDYHISICGVYALNYSGGMVTGPIGPNISSMNLNDFASYVHQCFTPTTQSIDDEELLDAQVFMNGTDLNVQLGENLTSSVQLVIYSVQGQVLSQGTLSRNTETVALGHLPKGVYLIRISAQQAVLTRRVVLE